MNLLTRMRAFGGEPLVVRFVDSGWPHLVWRKADGLVLSLDATPLDGEGPDGISRFRVSLDLDAGEGDAGRTQVEMIVRVDGAVVSDDGETAIADEIFSLASGAELVSEA